MNVKTFLQRKFRTRWSDLQLLVMLALVEEQLLCWAELVELCKGSETGTWNAITVIQTQDCASTFVIQGKTYYHLTEKGRSEIHKLLK